MMSPLVLALCLAGALPERPSYLFKMDVGPGKEIQLHGEPYCPQPGDLIFFDDHSSWTKKLYKCCGTSTPGHVGVVLRQRDDSLVFLEAGPNGVWKVFVVELEQRLHKYDGTILIRHLRTPLTPEQSQQLTEFALAQEGKPYALGRLMLQGTPLRTHGTVRSQLFGRTVLDRDRWICSELAAAALTVAGVLDPSKYPANAMYPRDLCYDERHDLSPFFESPALWYPMPDLVQVGAGVRIEPSLKR